MANPEDKAADQSASQRDALAFLEAEVRYGFLSADKIHAELIDRFGKISAPEGKGWKELIRQASIEHLKSVEAEGEQHDFFKLAKAFDHLNRGGIISVHRAGADLQEGFGTVRDIMQEYQTTGIAVRGFCFYHDADLKMATDPSTRQLFLAFDSIDKNDGTALMVGRDIVQVLEAAGLSVSWNENLEERILIDYINWKKTPDANEWGARRAIVVAGKTMESIDRRELSEKFKKSPAWMFWKR
jgi:hypothetical protein